MTPMEKWGKDHWSLFAYVETVCVDRKPIDRERVRCNPLTHVLLQGYRTRMLRSPIVDGRYQYPTRLKDGETIAGHDDWDVLDDLEEAGLVEIYSLVNGFVRMTTKGSRVAALLRQHKSNGGSFASFSCLTQEPPQTDIHV